MNRGEQGKYVAPKMRLAVSHDGHIRTKTLHNAELAAIEIRLFV